MTIRPQTTAHQASDRYLAEKVQTASPAELTAMLFDACVAALHGALRLQRLGDHLGALPRLQKAQDIVLELRTTLNPEAGSLADSLDALYTYSYTQLLEASLRRECDGIQAALDVLQPLQQAWRTSCLHAAA